LPLPTQKKEIEEVGSGLVGAAHQPRAHLLYLKKWGGVGYDRRSGKPLSDGGWKVAFHEDMTYAHIEYCLERRARHI